MYCEIVRKNRIKREGKEGKYLGNVLTLDIIRNAWNDKMLNLERKKRKREKVVFG